MQLQCKPWKTYFQGSSCPADGTMRPQIPIERWEGYGGDFEFSVFLLFFLINCTNWSALWWLTCDVAVLKHSKVSLWNSSQLYVHLLLLSFYNILKKVIQFILITDFITPNYFQILPINKYMKLHTVFFFLNVSKKKERKKRERTLKGD